MIYFIVNPNAGGAKGFETWKAAENRLQKLKVEYKEYLTTGPGDAIAFAREICEANPDKEITVVPVGGDGTFNEVLNGLTINDKLTVGYIPTGSGNDLARGLKLSGNPAKCIDKILARQNVIYMDYGVLTFGQNEVVNRRFAVSAGIGYDAAVCVAIDHSAMRRHLSKLKLQKQVYLMIGALEMLKIKATKGHIIMDDSRKVEFNDIIFISIHNHVTEGGGKKFAPQADYQDGLLSLCIIHTKTLPQFVGLLVKAIAGNHPKEKGVRLYDCKNVKIHLDKPKPVHTDGEIFEAQSDIELHCVEKKLRIIV